MGVFTSTFQRGIIIMGTSDRRKGTKGRRAIDHNGIEDVSILDGDLDQTNEDISFGGVPVSVPHSCGSDENEHRMVTPFVCAGYTVATTQH